MIDASQTEPALEELAPDALAEEVFELVRRSGVALALRLDDVGPYDEGVRRIVEGLLRAGLGINLEVVPSLLDSKTAGWLRSLRAEYSGLVEAHQHGWVHANHETVGRKQEFGPARAYGPKLEDMRRGKRLMEDELPELFFPVFCPPWNRMDGEALRACAEAGYSAVSAFDLAPGDLPAGVADLSATFDWEAARGAGEAGLLPALEDICRRAAGGRDSIIMLHPHVMDESSTRGLMLLAESGARRRAPFLTFSRMLARRAAA